MKFDGSPFGLGARGVFDRSMPGERDSIAAVLQVDMKRIRWIGGTGWVKISTYLLRTETPRRCHQYPSELTEQRRRGHVQLDRREMREVLCGYQLISSWMYLRRAGLHTPMHLDAVSMHKVSYSARLRRK